MKIAIHLKYLIGPLMNFFIYPNLNFNAFTLELN